MQKATSPIALTKEGCQARQARLIEALKSTGCDAALLSDRPNVHSFCGHWTREVYCSLLLLRADGQTFLASPVAPASTPFVDRVVEYPAAPLGTLVDDQLQAAIASLRQFFSSLKSIGTDGFASSNFKIRAYPSDISSLLRSLRRKKLPDEIALIEQGIRACEAVYATARKRIQPGLSEWSLYVESLAIATEAIGEPIGELGNDFQSGTPGGSPRHRTMEAQELLPLDLSVIVRGYHSDLCRTFAIGKQPNAAQREAHRRVLDALQYVEATVKPGVSCRKLYEDVSRMLKGHPEWDFPHHLGHGVGLSAHETPRLNPNWDDYFQEGDVFAAEPGLYGSELYAGVRIEQDYVVTETGIKSLSTFPVEL